METIRDYWPIIAFALTAGAWVARELWLSYTHIEKRVTAQEQAHIAHEDICSERYQRLADNHAQLVKVSDERHEENKDRLESIDKKIDLLIDRLP